MKVYRVLCMSMFFSLIFCIKCMGAAAPDGQVSVVVNTNAYQGLAAAVGAAAQKGIQDPYVVVWFSGVGKIGPGGSLPGLTQRSFDFYKPLPEFLAKNFSGFKLFLYDLLAWRGFQERSSSLSATTEPLAERAKEVLAFSWGRAIDIVRSNDFFSELFSGQMALDLCRDIVARPLLYRLSEAMVSAMPAAQKNQLMQKALKCNNDFASVGQSKSKFQVKPELEQLLGKKRPATTYSMMQYLEGLWVARELARRRCQQDPDVQRPINLMFLLPYSGEIPEYSYYCPGESGDSCGQMFRQDFCRLIARDTALSGRVINIYFYGFNYDFKGCKRPYIRVAEDITYSPDGGAQ